MPINAGPEYFKSEEQYRKARTDPEKLAALQEMLRTAPKHKSSETLIREITRKIGELRRKMQKQVEFEKARAKKVPSMTVKKEGAGQVVLVGAPNSGKSTLVKTLTQAEVLIAPYPFTTVKPVAGMMNFKGARVQLVDLPPIIEGSSSGKMQGTEVLSVARNADAILMPVKSVAELKVNLIELANAGIRVVEAKPHIHASESKFGGINIAGREFLNCSEGETRQFIKGLGFNNLNLVLFENTSLKELADVLNSRISFKKAVVICFDEKTFKAAKAFVNDLLKERLKEKIREKLAKETSLKLREKIRHELMPGLREWFDKEKSIQLQKRLRKWMKMGEQDRVEKGVETELKEKLNAKLDSMTENKLKERLNEETEKEFNEKSNELLERERTGVQLMLLNKGNFDELRKKLFELLDVILIFTKKPGQEPDFKEPLILKKGATAEDAAFQLHKELARKLKYVKVWGSSKFPGQRVSKDYPLQNDDIIEITA